MTKCIRCRQAWVLFHSFMLTITRATCLILGSGMAASFCQCIKLKPSGFALSPHTYTTEVRAIHLPSKFQRERSMLLPVPLTRTDCTATRKTTSLFPDNPGLMDIALRRE